DTAARLAEEQFGVLLSQIPTATDATTVAGLIQEALIQPFQVDGQELYLHVSIGIALSTSDYTAAENALRDADTAMHRVKVAGSNQIEIFDEKMRSHVAGRIQRERELRRALEREELRVYYQPIIALDTGKITGFEALVRWQHGSDLLQPKDFVPFAEQTGLIIPLEKFVLRQTLEQLRFWTTNLPFDPQFTVSVNLSAGHYSDPHLVDDLKRVLDLTGVDPSRLKLEIT